MRVDPTRQTPAVRHNDGLDYVPTNKYVLFGHHFAAIAGAGPLVGPVLAAQMGYLPGTLWILAGVVFAGAVQDFIVLMISTRRDGRSLGDIIRAEMGPVAGGIALIGVLLIMIILLAVLAMVVVKALAGSPWGTFTVFCTIPTAMIMGIYCRFIRPGRDRRNVGHRRGAAVPRADLRSNGVGKPDVGTAVHLQRRNSGPDHHRLRLRRLGAAGVAAAGAARLFVDLPQDRHDLCAGGRHPVVMPDLKMPAVTKFVDGTGPVFSGNLFPFLFITIACGAVSGLPFADFVGNHAEDDRERSRRPASSAMAAC